MKQRSTSNPPLPWTGSAVASVQRRMLSEGKAGGGIGLTPRAGVDFLATISRASFFLSSNHRGRGAQGNTAVAILL